MSEKDALVGLQVTLAYLVPCGIMVVNWLLGGRLLEFGLIPEGMELACPP